MTRPEIELALALLKAVDNPADDIAVAAAMRSPISVSYTHLDVYKRQISDCMGQCAECI